jgi:hypothetical protein
MGGGLESLWVGRVYRADGAESHNTIRTAHTNYAAALKTTTHPKTLCRKPYAITHTSNAHDDGRIYPKYVELRIHLKNNIFASSWGFKLFQLLSSYPPASWRNRQLLDPIYSDNLVERMAEENGNLSDA